MIVLIGCSSSDNYHSSDCNYYTVLQVDDKAILGYNVVVLSDSSDQKLFLLSARLGSHLDKPMYKNYDSIQAGKKYKIKLVRQDSAYIVNQMEIAPGPGTNDLSLYYFDILFWRNHSIKTVIYTSPNVFDRFIQIIK